MTTTHQSLTRTLLTGVVGVALIGGLVAGCQLFDSQSSPTVPQQSVSTEQVGQCFATSEAPTEWAYSYTPGEAVFCVSVPEAGAYLLRYVVNGGTHEVVFEISAAKRVYIGLLSNADELTAVSLQRGTLRDGATPLEGDRGDIRFYALPGSGVTPDHAAVADHETEYSTTDRMISRSSAALACPCILSPASSTAPTRSPSGFSPASAATATVLQK